MQISLKCVADGVIAKHSQLITVRVEQNGQHFADDFFRGISWMKILYFEFNIPSIL